MGKSSTKTVPTKEFSLYRSQNVVGTDNDKERNVVHRTGTTDHSVFYHVPSHFDHLKASLAEKINEVFPFGVGLGLTSSANSDGTTIEISLIDQAACEKAISVPIITGGHSFYASPAVHPDQALLKVNLSKLPIWQLDKLRHSLLNNFSRYGVVREISIYLDDWSGCWFTGNGHLYIERPNHASKQYETLTYKIDLEDGNTFCLGTWSKMGKHCVYCKASDHYRKECTKAPEEKRRCSTCGSKGHIARNCHRAITDSNTSSKRRRDSTQNPKVSTVATPVAIEQATPLIEPTAPIEAISETEDVNRPNGQVDAAFDTIVQVEVPEVLEVPEIHETPATSVPSHPSTVDSTPLQGEPSNIRSRTTRMQLRSTPTPSAKLASSVLVDAIKGCKRCGGKDHQKSSSLKCPMNKKYTSEPTVDLSARQTLEDHCTTDHASEDVVMEED